MMKYLFMLFFVLVGIPVSAQPATEVITLTPDFITFLRH